LAPPHSSEVFPAQGVLQSVNVAGPAVWAMMDPQ